MKRIKLSKETYRILQDFKNEDESDDDVIMRLIEKRNYYQDLYHYEKDEV